MAVETPSLVMILTDDLGYGDCSCYGQQAWSTPNIDRMVQRIDITVGRVLSTLRELGLAERTLVVFTSDNGPHNEGGHSVTRFDSAGGFRGYKRSLHEGGIRVSFLVWQPGTVAPGVTDHLGYFPDILPTFCDLSDAACSADTDGVSLAPLLRGDRSGQARHDGLYFEYQDQLAVRRGGWKYYRSAAGEAPYDLADDRHEDRDVQAGHPEVLAELRAIAAREHRDGMLVPVPVPVAYDRGGRPC